MLKKCLFVLLSFLFSVASFAADVPSVPENLDDALEALDDALIDRKQYINRRVSRIDSIRTAIYSASDSERMELYQQIGNEYRIYNVDSALYYYTEGRNLAVAKNDSVGILRYDLLTSSLMPIVGIMKEEIDFFDNIKVSQVPPELLAMYYYMGSKLFFSMSQFYSQFPELQTKYAYRGLENNDSLLKYLEPNSPIALLHQAQSYFMHKQTTLAVATLNDMLEITDPSDNLYARGANVLAAIYKMREKKKEQMYYLALSALSDVWSGTLEETSLMELGLALYADKDIDRAYKYVTISMNNAVACGAKMRALEASLALPYVAQNYAEKEARNKQAVFIFIVCLIVAVLALIIVVMLLRREMTRLRLLKTRLSEANDAKEAYNSHFLNLASIYMDKLEEFNRYAGRKIAAKQVDDLYSFIKSGKIMEEQSQVFYDVFDKAFVYMYPSFVDDVNRLLQPDKQIVLPEGVVLNTELRIIAFMRIGLDDSNQIARFLNLSLSTIYTYRNKLKSRAISRESFETDVMKIGKID